MATIEDYMSGRVCELIKQTFSIFESSEQVLNGTDVGEAMLNNVKKLEPKRLAIDEAIGLIQESKQCAIGERVCRSVHIGSPLTESVFLDDLAAGMVQSGKARFATKEEAIDNIKKYQENPIIVSKVSGQHSEICPTWPKKCLYWNMEKRGLGCIGRS